MLTKQSKIKQIAISIQQAVDDDIPIVNDIGKYCIKGRHQKYYHSSRKSMYSKNLSTKNTQKIETEHIRNDNKMATVTLSFQQGKNSECVKGVTRKTFYKNITHFQRKNNFSTITESPNKTDMSKQKSRKKQNYSELFKQSLNNFFKTTFQIGPFSKGSIKDTLDPLQKRKLINIERISFPVRHTRPITIRNKTSISQINKTYRQDEFQQKTHKRAKSYINTNLQYYPDENNFSDARVNAIKKRKLKSFMLESLVPIRKPHNRKDYFVFGMTDRTCATENKIQLYRDFLWKINYSNSLFVFTPSIIKNYGEVYKFYVGPGNNCNLIKGIMKRRFWWQITHNKNEEGIHFMWTQLKYNQFFSNQQENQILFPSPSLKSSSSQAHPLIMSDFSQISKIFNFSDLDHWTKHYKKNQKTEKTIQETTYKKRIHLYEKKHFFTIEDSNLLRIHNHLQSNYYIGNKKALFYNIRLYYSLRNKDPFSIIPHTFHLKKGMDDQEWKNFIYFYEKMELLKKNNKNFRNMWIVKPGQNTNRGTGISVAYGLDDIKVRIKGRQRNRDGQFRTFILQKYIQNPLLYQKRKFDLRHYGLIACINGIFKFYWYEEGYIRTSSSEFSMKNNRDPMIHLTNDAIQKNASDYGKYEKGNKLSYSDFQKYLEQTYPHKKYNIFEQVLPKMKEYATQAFKASYSILDSKRLGHNFQLLGFDFMIDQDFEPWLIEVNTNPCLELSSPLLARIIPNLIENVARICIDPLFPPPQCWPSNKKIFFNEDPLSENKFILAFDEIVEGMAVRETFKDQITIDGNMGKIEEQQDTYQDDGKEDWDDKKQYNNCG